MLHRVLATLRPGRTPITNIATLPDPIYPSYDGTPVQEPESEPHKKYYVVLKGLKLGVFYENWSVTVSSLSNRRISD